MATIGDILGARRGVVWRVSPQQSVLDAIRLMAEKGVGALAVMDGEQLVGILSERDYARKVILADRSSDTTRVGDIMTAKVASATCDLRVDECMALMTEKRFRHLPVVEDGRVIGMISIGDLVKAVIAEQQYTIDQLEHYIAG